MISKNENIEYNNFNFDSLNFDVLLTNLQSPINSTREEAEIFINKYSENNYEKILNKLASLLSDEKISEGNRQMVCYLMKNIITSKDNLPKWFSINNENIKNYILSSLASEKGKIRRAAGNLIANITNLESMINWPPSGIISLMNNIAITSENINYIVSAIQTLGFILEEFTINLEWYKNNNTDFSPLINEILHSINFNLKNQIKRENNFDNDIVIVCLKSFINILPLYNEERGQINNFEINLGKFKFYENVLITIFQLSEFLFSGYLSENNENNKNSTISIQIIQILELISQVLIHSCDKLYFNMANQMEYFVKFTNFIISFYQNNHNSQNDLERSILLTLEIWCNIGDKELSLSNIYTSDKISLKYFSKYGHELYKFSYESLIYISDNDDWSISKASAYILCILVQLSDSSFLEKLLVYSENNYCSENEIKRYSSLIALSCCLETVHRDKISYLLKYNFHNFIKTMSDKSELVSRTSSWLLCKITEFYPYTIDKSMLSKYIDLFMKIIQYGNDNGFFKDEEEKFNHDYCGRNPNINDIDIDKDFDKFNKMMYNKQIRKNLCIVLINLIKYYGDKKTSKNNNALSPYYKHILNSCVYTAFNIENFIDNKNNNIYLFSFHMMNCVIDYSSLDFQDQLEIVLITYIDLFDKINKDLLQLQINSTANKDLYILSNFSQKVNFQNINYNKIKEFLLNLQEDESILIEKIFKKIIRKVKSEYCIKFYQNIIYSFKIRGVVYESGLLCLSQIVINLQVEFVPYLNELMELLINSLKKFNDTTLCKTAVVTITNIISSLSNYCEIYTDEIIAILLNILLDENISRSVKLVTISLLGDICLNIPSVLLKGTFFESLMGLLFSACETSIYKIEEGDIDTEDYISELKKILLECFTSITFAIKDLSYLNKDSNNNYMSNLLTLYAPYLIKIFSHLKSFINEKCSEELMINSLAFISDVSTMYPKEEVKILINQEFIIYSLNKIKLIKNEKYSTTIHWIDKTISEFF